jgi:hypothetical protein
MNATGHRAVENCGNLLEFIHHHCELLGIDGLRPVRESLVGLVMYLDHDAVGAHGNGCSRHGDDFVALTRSMAGVYQDGQMAQALHRRDDAQIERISSVIGKSSHPALA